MTSLTKVLPPSSATQLSTLLTPSSQPVPLLSAPLAKGYGYAHTAGVLLYYYLRAGDLVRDPLATLLQDILPLAVFQSLFCAVCLPVAGTWHSGTGDVSQNGRAADNISSRKTGAIPTTGSVRRKAGLPGTSARGAGSGREYVRGGPWPSRIMVSLT